MSGFGRATEPLVAGLACQHTVGVGLLLLVAVVGSQNWCEVLGHNEEEVVESLAAQVVVVLLAFRKERKAVGTQG